MDITEALARAAYPGRGLMVFRSGDGRLGAAYWLTGRSIASKSRALIGTGSDLVAADVGGIPDDPLRHYRAACQIDGFDIIGNGRHVDDLAAALAAGVSAFAALCGLQPEPDPPLRTARIVALIERESGAVLLGAARNVPGGSAFDHVALQVGSLPLGTGIFICTYQGEPAAPSVWAEPTWIEAAGTAAAQAEATWSGLGTAYRVALAWRQIDKASSEAARTAAWTMVASHSATSGDLG